MQQRTKKYNQRYAHFATQHILAQGVKQSTLVVNCVDNKIQVIANASHNRLLLMKRD